MIQNSALSHFDALQVMTKVLKVIEYQNWLHHFQKRHFFGVSFHITMFIILIFHRYDIS